MAGDAVGRAHRSRLLASGGSRGGPPRLARPHGGCPIRPPLWPLLGALSTADHAIRTRRRRATGVGCLRQYRHALGAEALPPAWLRRSHNHPQGPPPVPPAHLALATRGHAATQVAEDVVIAATTMERRIGKINGIFAPVSPEAPRRSPHRLDAAAPLGPAACACRSARSRGRAARTMADTARTVWLVLSCPYYFS
jgi:hypothetical protein